MSFKFSDWFEREVEVNPALNDQKNELKTFLTDNFLTTQASLKGYNLSNIAHMHVALVSALSSAIDTLKQGQSLFRMLLFVNNYYFKYNFYDLYSLFIYFFGLQLMLMLRNI